MVAIAITALFVLVSGVTLIHCAWFVRLALVSWRYLPDIENPANMVDYLKNRGRRLQRQQTIAFGMLLVIACANLIVSLSGMGPRIKVSAIVFGGPDAGGILRFGLVGIYWGVSLVLALAGWFKVRHQLQTMWVLRNSLPIDMSEYTTLSDKPASPVLPIVGVVVIAALLIALVLFARFI